MTKSKNREQLGDLMESFKIVDEKGPNARVKTIRYLADGQNDDKAKKKFDDQDTVASKILNGREVLFKIKCKNSLELYNPLEEDRSYGLNKIEKEKGVPTFKFREVSDRCFDYYINFLKTKQKNIFDMAQREVL